MAGAYELHGPTASGKSALALRLAQVLPLDIVSVYSMTPAPIPPIFFDSHDSQRQPLFDTARLIEEAGGLTALASRLRRPIGEQPAAAAATRPLTVKQHLHELLRIWHPGHLAFQLAWARWQATGKEPAESALRDVHDPFEISGQRL